MFFTGTATETIGEEIYDELKNNKDVKEVIPFATGDNYMGGLIVGTESSFLREKNFESGNNFSKAFEIVLGHNVAEKNGLKIGDKIIGSHGVAESSHSHENNPYTVVGILQKTYTAYDNTLFTKTDSVWETHENHEEHDDHEEHEHKHEYTAILVKTKNPSEALNLMSELNKKAGILAVNPSTVLRELLENIDFVKNIVYVLCAVIGIMSFVIIYMINLVVMQDVKKDVLLMRLLGLQRKNISKIILLQNGVISILGVFVAFLLTRISLILVNNITASMGIVMNYTKIYVQEYLIMIVVIIISLIPALISLWRMFERSLEDEK